MRYQINAREESQCGWCGWCGSVCVNSKSNRIRAKVNGKCLSIYNCMPMCIQNNLIVRKPKAKYLGHIISENMSDDADVFRQVKCLYIRGNIISRKFANCSINVKLVVFKTYCSCLYTSQLWGTCLSRTMNRLKVAYNDFAIFRLMTLT